MTAREAEVERVDVTRRAHVPLLHLTSQHVSPPPLQGTPSVVLAADATPFGARAQQKHGAAQVQYVGCGACFFGPSLIASFMF